MKIGDRVRVLTPTGETGYSGTLAETSRVHTEVGGVYPVCGVRPDDPDLEDVMYAPSEFVVPADGPDVCRETDACCCSRCMSD